MNQINSRSLLVLMAFLWVASAETIFDAISNDATLSRVSRQKRYMTVKLSLADPCPWCSCLNLVHVVCLCCLFPLSQSGQKKDDAV